MFAQAVGRNAGERAWLYSQYFPPTQATCFSFWYFMYGTGKILYSADYKLMDWIHFIHSGTFFQGRQFL